MMTQVIYKQQKDTGIAYLCWLATFVLVAGLQHFYLGKPWKGLLWIFTWGLLGIGTVWDLFTLKGQVRKVNNNL